MSDALAARDGKTPPLLFLRKFLRHGKRVASFMPSSRFLARAMCRVIDPTRPQTILELGAGTGAVTKIAARRMHPESRLIAVEIDPQFCQHLARECPRAEVLCADVRNISRQLDAIGVDKVDVFLNGLPTPSLPKMLNRVVLDCFRQYAPEAVFAQLTVMPLVYKPMYGRLFESVQFRFVMRNIPPAGVYFCRGLKPDYLSNIPGPEIALPPLDDEGEGGVSF